MGSFPDSSQHKQDESSHKSQPGHYSNPGKSKIDLSSDVENKLDKSSKSQSKHEPVDASGHSYDPTNENAYRDSEPYNMDESNKDKKQRRGRKDRSSNRSPEDSQNDSSAECREKN